MPALPSPSATDNPESLADWLELNALQAADQNSSLQDLTQVIRRTGTVEELDSDEDDSEDDTDDHFPDRGAEQSQRVSEDAFSEIEDRFSSCGGEEKAYPYTVQGQYIELRKKPEESIYLFLLLLSQFGKDAGPPGIDAASLFEKVCIEAARSYFGVLNLGVEGYHFGAPRRSTPKKFADALNEMCARMGEGVGCRLERPRVEDQKDAKLDLVVWRHFPDNRAGKLIGFGQCATGNNWREKISELQPGAFCKLWMKDVLAVDPVRIFFVPFRIEKSRWLEAVLYGGIIFDRCRIAFHTHDIDTDTLRDCGKWTKYVLKKVLKA